MNPTDILNELLVYLFRDIMSIEEKAIITDEFKDITNNDMHVIEAVGICGGRNMTSVAKDLSVTVGTLTIAINNLVKKGYVERVRSEKDRRVVLVSLTDKGRRAYEHHRRFHQEMVEAVLADLEPQEVESLSKTLSNLIDFFRNYPNK